MRFLHHIRSAAPLMTLLLVASGCDDQASSPLEAQTDRLGHTAGLQEAEAWETQMGPAPRVEFADLEIFLEFNSTDDDLGVQVFLDAEDWDRVRAKDPAGRRVLDFRAHDSFGDLGLTELRFESAEPSPGEVLAAIPAGEYSFTGRTVERGLLVGTAELSHDLPPAPDFTPDDGDVVDADNTVIEWRRIAGVQGYEVIVENQESELTLSALLGPDATRLTVPAEFMERDTEYKAEVLAIAENGNKTITEHVFRTR
ncbi:MAG: hypothetical protein ACRELD_11780 [Longimicrobiales bacterium]